MIPLAGAVGAISPLVLSVGSPSPLVITTGARLVDIKCTNLRSKRPILNFVLSAIPKSISGNSAKEMMMIDPCFCIFKTFYITS